MEEEENESLPTRTTTRGWVPPSSESTSVESEEINMSDGTIELNDDLSDIITQNGSTDTTTDSSLEIEESKDEGSTSNTNDWNIKVGPTIGDVDKDDFISNILHSNAERNWGFDDVIKSTKSFVTDTAIPAVQKVRSTILRKGTNVVKDTGRTINYGYSTIKSFKNEDYLGGVVNAAMTLGSIIDGIKNFFTK